MYPDRPMPVRIRLTRVGSKKNPIWRIVVADKRSPRDGRSIETIGRYNPQTEPSLIEVDEDRARHWLERGAQPSQTAAKLLRTKGIQATGTK
jgi:small subunit ribosomal protein S16